MDKGIWRLINLVHITFLFFWGSNMVIVFHRGFMNFGHRFGTNSLKEKKKRKSV